MVHMVGTWEEMSVSNCVNLHCGFSSEFQGSTHYKLIVEMLSIIPKGQFYVNT